MAGSTGDRPDPFDLARFLAAQAPVIDQVRRELAAGRKTSHWMWFVFPQFAGLGHSAMAETYAIGSPAEARAYLGHPVLGARLEELTRLVIGHAPASPRQIFGSPDDLKFRSSMTLFAEAAGPGSLYAEALERLCAGQPDPRTRALLAGRD